MQSSLWENDGVLQRCTDSDMESVLLKEVALAHAQKRPPRLSPELATGMREVLEDVSSLG